MLELKLALRFVASRRKGALTRFISFASTCGIAMGVFAAVVGFSAMNGFEYELEHRVLSVIPYAQLNSGNNAFQDEHEIENVLMQSRNIVAVAPAITQNAILTNDSNFAPVLLTGIKPQDENKVISIQRFVNTPLECLDPSNITLDGCDLSAFNENLSPADNPILRKSALNSKINEDTKTSVASKGTSASMSKDGGEVKEIEEDIIASDNEDMSAQNLEQNKAHASAAATAALQAQEAVASLPSEHTLYHHTPRIVLGASIAKKLNTKVGDYIYLVTLGAKHNDHRDLDAGALSKSLKMPEKTKVLVSGIVKIGGQIDTSIAIMFFDDLKVITKLSGANTIHIKTKSLINADRDVYEASRGKIHESAYLVTWMSSQGKLYHDIQMVRQIMFVAMFLVLAVACFNIISNLMMLVGEKRREIAILLTMGMRPRVIVRTFSIMGLLSGGYGAIIGLVLGVLVSLSITPITQSFPKWFGFPLLNEDVYFINFIPCRLALSDVFFVISIALIMSVCAALYPALRAARVKPAHELNI